VSEFGAIGFQCPNRRIERDDDSKGRHLVGHGARECVDLPGVYGGGGAALGAGAVEGGLGACPLGFQSDGALPRSAIDRSDAIFDRTIGAASLAVGESLLRFDEARESGDRKKAQGPADNREKKIIIQGERPHGS
jgi:hypothetical protein